MSILSVIAARRGGSPAPLESLKLGKPLGKGGFAVVYSGRLALDAGGELRCAVKVLHPEFCEDNADNVELRLFKEEAEVILSLEHPNIINAYGLLKLGPGFPGLNGYTQPAYALVLELMEGGSLAGLMVKQLLAGSSPKYTFTQALGWALDVARALQYLHAGGRDGAPRIHRDVKLENVLLTDGAHTAKLADFGLQRAVFHQRGAQQPMLVRRSQRPPPNATPPAAAAAARVTGPSRLALDPHRPSAATPKHLRSTGTGAESTSARASPLASTAHPTLAADDLGAHTAEPGPTSGGDAPLFYALHETAGLVPLGPSRGVAEVPGTSPQDGNGNPMDRIISALEIARRSASMPQLDAQILNGLQAGPTVEPSAAISTRQPSGLASAVASVPGALATSPQAANGSLLALTAKLAPVGGSLSSRPRSGSPRFMGGVLGGASPTRPSPLGGPSLRSGMAGEALAKRTSFSLRETSAAAQDPAATQPSPASMPGERPPECAALSASRSLHRQRSEATRPPPLTTQQSGPHAPAAGPASAGDAASSSPAATPSPSAAGREGPERSGTPTPQASTQNVDLIVDGQSVSPTGSGALAARPPSSRQRGSNGASSANAAAGGGPVMSLTEDGTMPVPELPGCAAPLTTSGIGADPTGAESLVGDVTAVSFDTDTAAAISGPRSRRQEGELTSLAEVETQEEVEQASGTGMAMSPTALEVGLRSKSVLQAGSGAAEPHSAPLAMMDLLQMRLGAGSVSVRSVRGSASGRQGSATAIPRLAELAAATRAAAANGGGVVVSSPGGGARCASMGGSSPSKLASKKGQQAEFEEVFSLTGRTGSLVYLAPEAYKNEPYNDKVDVYSLAILIYELFGRTSLTYTHISTKLPAFSRMLINAEDFADRVAAGYRPPRPNGMSKLPPELWELIESAWHQDPVQRPDIDSVVETLEALVGPVAEAEAGKGGKASQGCSCVIC
ncbi:hypothetical protein HYH03_008099 [Edaphochlamys debaryana]|uniref:Protein kinase domain-containing protein n=1 Tax=Edaphochlamys debaryana TaxID=47281 RepID=A0A835Y6Y8_9CHLO|nr:hypothetical protein HYH03_008099 [Edaphochlamys debaryana]|eukprot:KAG2493580.1 hypothetical protein HYH03_008099 [Edaphochlamys debaryana]